MKKNKPHSKPSQPLAPGETLKRLLELQGKTVTGQSRKDKPLKHPVVFPPND